MFDDMMLEKEAGGRHLLLGNEAIVRGALEAGVNVVTCYPGTPSSEVPDLFYHLQSCGRYRMEYSVNEKVAVEVAAGVALAGGMSLTTMKHVGVNVAADPLFTSCYIGMPGGMVLMSADDPLCHSSQDEQDNRTYARFMGMPCLEPATAQEAKDMTKEAFLMARELQQPVMLRTTTRVSHLRGAVTFGDLGEPAKTVPFEKNPMRFVPVPAVASRRHYNLEEQLAKALEKSEHSPWNSTSGSGRIGVIASGIGRAYLADALAEQGWEDRIRILELGFTWPLPKKKISDFLAECDKVLVIEELRPLVEDAARAIAQECGLQTAIFGKGKYLTPFGEYSTVLVARALADFLGESLPERKAEGLPDISALPGRPPNLCSGCSHRAVYYAARKVFGDEAVYSSDIGCYTLGIMPPLRTADFLLCMGSSISAGSGFAMMDDRPVVGFIGDSTFFHSGMTGLANAVFNRHNMLLVILDNGTTAMTGHQPNPGVASPVLGGSCEHLDIEAVVRSLGVNDVEKVKPFNVNATIKTFEAMKQRTGVRVIIAEEPCMLFARRTLKQQKPQVAYVAQQGEKAVSCLNDLACPAFRREKDEQGKDIVGVDESQCVGCMVCLQIAPTAFKARKRS
ncbi:MAG: indolepyruvate ferredoxin oxidoreductase subunit alpha [Desulfovibrionaceae bacterium]|nr:indolepyruvate ferredoxin oxidoreductase subunit alpha [Desulfovibrionaceae bacterium]